MGQRPEIKNYTKADFAMLQKAAVNVFYFASLAFIRHPVKGRVNFKLYPYQIKVLWYFLTQRFNIVLKFRQAGLTELIALYVLWFALFHPNKNIQIISIKDRVAKRVLGRIKYIYRNLPPILQTPVINGRPGDLGTNTEMEFSNGSIITSIPTTEDAGRSEAVSLLVIDEAAMVRWATKIWAAAFPTLSTGGSSIINSTPYGVGGWYHQTWVEALSGGNGFNPIRLRWEMHPERDDAWYQTMRSVLGPKRTAQEIDGDFLSSGDSVFDLLDIRAIEDSLDDSTVTRKLNGNLLIFKAARRNQKCFIGADVASGRSRDYSSFSIMDRTGDELACFKGKIPPDRFADLLMHWGREYNYAQIAPEANSIGLATVSRVANEGYPNLYYSTSILKEKGKRKPKVEKIPGWLTTSKNRPVIIDELESDIRNDQVNIKNPFFVSEAYTFIYDGANRPVAMGKDKKRGSQDEELEDDSFSDDAIFGECITNFTRKGKINTIIIAPQ
jgi:hypothetical protein